MEYVSPRGRNALVKANSFASFASEYGWQSKVSQRGDEVHLFARRAEETLDCYWIDGCWSGESFYTLAGGKTKCHNLSAASKFVVGKPDSKRLVKATRRLARGNPNTVANAPISEDEVMSLRGSVPFDSESSDEEIEAVLHKRAITWVNTISGQVDSARIDVDKQFKIVRKNGNEKIKADFITFCSAEGYRAVYLKSIVAVS